MLTSGPQPVNWTDDGGDSNEPQCTVTVRPEIIHVTIKKKKERWRQAFTGEKSHDNNILKNCHVHVARKALRSPTCWNARRPAGYSRCRPSESGRMFGKSVAVLSDERLWAFSAGSTGSNGRVWSFTSSSDSAGAAEKCASPFPRQ